MSRKRFKKGEPRSVYEGAHKSDMCFKIQNTKITGACAVEKKQQNAHI